MANEDQLRILWQGVDAWNIWRAKNPDEYVDLSRADLIGANLRGADFSEACLNGANLHGADLIGADLSWANLVGADLSMADLSMANLFEAKLSEAELNMADLSMADLSMANFFGAKLRGAELVGAILIETNLERAILTGCKIYGISAWGLKLDGAQQNDLIITPCDEPVTTVDNLEVAQFIYLLLHNDKVRHVIDIDTITSKVVLVLGHFAPERKAVLDEIRNEIRKRDYLPIMFEFDKQSSHVLTKTISTLAHMSRFIVADITDAKSILLELEHIVPELPSIPIMPLILRSDYEFALFERIKRFPWVLEPFQYDDQAELIASIGDQIIIPAEKKTRECRPPRGMYIYSL